MERLSILLDKIFGRFFEVKEPPKYLSGKGEKTMAESPKITIDNVEYDYDTLSDRHKQIIGNMKYASDRISELNMKINQYQAAMLTYKRMLEQANNDTSEDNA